MNQEREPRPCGYQRNKVGLLHMQTNPRNENRFTKGRYIDKQDDCVEKNVNAIPSSHRWTCQLFVKRQNNEALQLCVHVCVKENGGQKKSTRPTQPNRKKAKHTNHRLVPI